EYDSETKRVQDMLSGIEKPQVSNIQARTAVLTWSPPPSLANGDRHTNGLPYTCSYEVALSDKGRDGKYRVIYSGEDLECNLKDLRPATDYHVRVYAMHSSVRGSYSEPVSFTTHSCAPECPFPPKLSQRTKSSITLQWKAPTDNGSKITSYLLEWDEGKRNNGFRECYFGSQRHYKLTKLCPAMGYTFRLAARNDIGTSGFSQEVVCYTSGNIPQTPAAPRLGRAGVTWITLQWNRPDGSTPEEVITYILEIQEESSDNEFHPKYTGEDLSCTVKNLKRSTQYKFRLIASNVEGKSGPSEILVCTTSPDRPGPPSRPYIIGPIAPHGFRVQWDPPQDTGGSEILKYLLEISEGNSDSSQWEVAYSGSAIEHACEHLKPGTFYKLRACCISTGGHSQVQQDLLHNYHSVIASLATPPDQLFRALNENVNLEWLNAKSGGLAFYMDFFPEVVQEVSLKFKSDVRCCLWLVVNGKITLFDFRTVGGGGHGPYSEASEVTTAAGPPGQCRAPFLTCKSSTCVLVSWESPEHSGADISEYRLEWGEEEGSFELVYYGTETSFEISNLSAATHYCCRLQAPPESRGGWSAPPSWLCLHSYRPQCPEPLRMLKVLLEVTCGYYKISRMFCLFGMLWGSETISASDIAIYSVQRLGDTKAAGGGGSSKATVLIFPTSPSRLRIQAVNEMGAGPFSELVKAKTRPLPPAPPRLECAAAGPQSLKLKWGESSTKVLCTDDMVYVLQIEDRNGRFIPIYRGPSHTYKVQRLTESTCYSFRIQAVNNAGEGPFTEICTFSTTKSVPPAVKAPRVTQLEGNTCEVTWEAAPPMKGDPVSYILQILVERESEYKQVFKGEDTAFQISGLQANTDYRFRVCVCRRCLDTSQELSGPFSPSVIFTLTRNELSIAGELGTADESKIKSMMPTDEQFAALIVLGFAILSILFAFLLQYFFMN
uniref:Fibronectin type III domain containing 3B n=1 Tax=Latimeria chalumnae TaxID=7897 RepID=H3B2E6_LATCH